MPKKLHYYKIKTPPPLIVNQEVSDFAEKFSEKNYLNIFNEIFIIRQSLSKRTMSVLGSITASLHPFIRNSYSLCLFKKLLRIMIVQFELNRKSHHSKKTPPLRVGF